MKNLKHKKLIVILLILVLIAVVIIVPCKVAPTVSDGLSLSSRSDSAPLMVAHRGFSAVCPDNTHSAFYAAVEAGFDGYEFDIHTTKDGQWVVIHDDTVDRMTDGTGNVEDFTLEEILKLTVDAGNGNEDLEYLAEKPTVPTLADALYYAQEYDIFPVIEIKKCDMQYLSSLKEYLDETKLSEKAVIISFTREYLEEYRKLDGETDMMLLSHSPSKEDVEWCLDYSAGLNFNHKNLYKCFSAVGYAKEKGVKIAAWTVDNTVYKDVMVLFGAQVITSNKIVPVD